MNHFPFGQNRTANQNPAGKRGSTLYPYKNSIKMLSRIIRKQRAAAVQRTPATALGHSNHQREGMAMGVILTDRIRGASGFSPQERLERLATVSTERKNWALTYLSSYAPFVFDAVLDQVEPITDETGADGRDETEPYCARCGQEIDAVALLALGWRHSDSDSPADTVRAVAAGEHEPLVAWRTAAPLPW
jgi:hypothetical protein